MTWHLIEPKEATSHVIEFEPDRSLLDHAALWLELQDLLGCKVDVVSEGGVKTRIRERVLREAVPG
jgi:uncharacterized protein